jgi:hypothetical protein
MDLSASKVNYNPYVFVLSKRNKQWEEDDKVIACNGCKNLFTMSLRRHHCRYCGKIFCSACCCNKILIPNENDNLYESDTVQPIINSASLWLFTSQTGEEIVCTNCYKLIGSLNENIKNIKTFLILDLTVKDVKLISSFNSSWMYACYYYLGKFKNIQFKQCYEKYTKLEKTLLQLNYHFFPGHSNYIYNLLKSCDSIEEVDQYVHLLQCDKVTDCASLLCSSNCSETLTCTQALALIKHYVDIYIEKRIRLTNLLQIALKYAICNKSNIPFFVHYLLYDDQNLIKNFIINEIDRRDIEFINDVYWQIKINIEHLKSDPKAELYSSLLSYIKRSNNMFSSQESFISQLQTIYNQNLSSYNVSGGADNQSKIILALNPAVISPLDTNIKIQNINLGKLKISNSATKPMIIPCETDDNNKLLIMYKKENVTQDLIIMNLIRIYSDILKNELGYDPQIVTYNILPIGGDSGLIEFVKNSKTMESIRNKNINILSHILSDNLNSSKEPDQKLNIIINSLAAYCVITYLLSVGDRHLDNIMITSKGQIFHIDYGYILGNEPMVETIFKSPLLGHTSIKLTADMIATFGGADSEHHIKFITKCCEVYSCLRKHADITLLQLFLIPNVTVTSITTENIIKVINSKFMLDKCEHDAVLIVKNEIEKNISCSTSYGESVKNAIHSTSTNIGTEAATTVINAGADAVVTAVSGVATGVASLWNWWSSK